MRRSRLEAVLFLAREPLSLRKLAQLANLADATEARTVLKSLQAAIRRAAVCVSGGPGGGGVSACSAGGNLLQWLRPQSCIGARNSAFPPALETLAVVAYRQPVLRAEVEAIRGVACGEILRQLMDRDLLRIVGRSEELGRPLRYGTTKRFLESLRPVQFGAASLGRPNCGERRTTDADKRRFCAENFQVQRLA